MKKIFITVSIFISVTVISAQTISAGYELSLAVCMDNTARAWGYNGYGQLGNGNNSDSYVPLPISFLSGIIAIAGGNGHSLALKNDNTVWTWGDNGHGQLGNGTYVGTNTPVLVSSLTNIKAIAAGSGYSIALKNDSTVWAWGSNGYGQLGNGSNTYSSDIPVQLNSLTGIIAIAGGGYFHSLALKSDGTVWAWGWNAYGQLGNGTTTNSSIPVLVSSLMGITAIAVGGSYSFALKNDGTVWAWGNNYYGTLGNGNNIDSNVPVQVSSLTGIIAISGGWWHSMALKNDGTGWAWGGNGYGQCGNGTNIGSNVPVIVSSLTGITSISGGWYHSLALKNNGTVWAWGLNWYGVFGNGTTSNSNVPVRVTELCPVATSCALPIMPTGINAIICPNNTTSLQAIGLGTLGWYSQATGGTYLGGGTNFITPTLTTDTTFYAQDSTCGASATRTVVTVTINYLKPPSPSASNITICSGSTASLSATGIGTLGWYTGATDGSYLGGGPNYTTPILTTNTTYYVQDSTCFASSMRTAVLVTIDTLKPPAPVASNNTICSGSTASLSAIGIGTLGWYTTAIDGIYLGGSTNYSTPVLTSTTTYYVQDSTCAASSTRTPVSVIVNPLPIVTAYATATSVCPGTTVTLIDTGAPNYEWTGGVLSGVGFIPSATSIYTVTGTDTNQCSNTSTITINVNLLDVTTNFNGGTITANQNGAVYQWLDCNNGHSPIAGATNQFYTPQINGEYAVIITKNSCSDTSACLNITTTLINEIVKNNSLLTVYPNPSNGSFTIQSTSKGVYSITNETGQTIQVFELNSTNKFSINIENLSNGIYFIVGVDNKHTTRQKLVVMK